MSARGGAVTKQQLAARSADGVAAFDARPRHFVTSSLRHFTASIALLTACSSAHALTIERSQASYENKHFNFELTAASVTFVGTEATAKRIEELKERYL